jgi:hypothetical protein
MTEYDLVIWFGVVGQFVRLVTFGILFFLAARELLKSKNGITIGLFLIAAGSSLNGLVSVFVPTEQVVHIFTRFLVGVGAWLMGLGAAWIIWKIRGNNK